MKRKLLFLTLCLLLRLGACPALAADALSVSASGGSAAPGETVRYSVSVSGNAGMAAWLFDLSWDSRALRLQGEPKAGALFSDGTLLFHQTEDGALSVIWFSPRNAVGDGEMFSLTFAVAEGAGSGVYPVALRSTPDGVTDERGTALSPAIRAGSVTVSGASGHTGGSGAGTASAGTDAVSDRPAAQSGGAAPARFSDVPQNAYYAAAVSWAVEHEITTGVDETHFAPDARCDRAQLVTFLWRAAGRPAANADNPFADVSETAYFYDAVLWAVGEGITNGTGDATFSPNAVLTRAQTVTFLCRYAQRAGGGPAADDGQPLAGDDAQDVPAWSREAFRWATANGVVQGSGGRLYPNDDCLRAQTVTMLERCFNRD